MKCNIDRRCTDVGAHEMVKAKRIGRNTRPPPTGPFPYKRIYISLSFQSEFASVGVRNRLWSAVSHRGERGRGRQWREGGERGKRREESARGERERAPREGGEREMCGTRIQSQYIRTTSVFSVNHATELLPTSEKTTSPSLL